MPLKTAILVTLLAGVVVTGTFAQGTIAVDNLGNDRNGSSSATSGGLFFLEPGVTYNGSFLNITVLGGASVGSLSPIVTLSGGNAMVYVGFPGVYADPTGGTYQVPGVAAQATAFLEVEVWPGSALTYAAATLIPGDLYSLSGMFQNPTGGAGDPPAVPQDLIGMPAVVFEIPEPSTIALGGVAAAVLVLLRCRK